MFISELKEIVPAQTLSRVTAVLRDAQFVSGHISGGHAQNKYNLELPPEDDAYLEALKLVEAAIRESGEFHMTAFPRYMTRPIFSRYTTDMHYKAHVDFPVLNFLTPQMKRAKGLAPFGLNYVRSDLSMTVFLSEPDTYDGGELAFRGTLEKVRIKLPAGSAVLYPTGVPHEVLRVSRGERLAAIFWIQSMFPVEAQRRMLCEANELRERLERTQPGSRELHLAEQVFYNSFRMLAEV
jgi:PKHD-type hydroxylase